MSQIDQQTAKQGEQHIKNTFEHMQKHVLEGGVRGKQRTIAKNSEISRTNREK